MPEVNSSSVFKAGISIAGIGVVNIGGQTLPIKKVGLKLE